MAVHFHPQPKGLPSVLTKHAKRKAASQALEDAYADVDARDAGYCWVTGRYTQPGAVDQRRRREHHHLKGRNVKPEWVTQPDRIITVAADVHALITAEAITVEGCDARKPIFFHWNQRIVKPGREPFRINTKRPEAE